jgi:hypothetical protein
VYVHVQVCAHVTSCLSLLHVHYYMHREMMTWGTLRHHIRCTDSCDCRAPSNSC